VPANSGDLGSVVADKLIQAKETKKARISGLFCGP
jgi:hypothetical protein